MWADESRFPSAEVEDFLLAVERLLVAADRRDVPARDIGELAGIRPVIRDGPGGGSTNAGSRCPPSSDSSTTWPRRCRVSMPLRSSALVMSPALERLRHLWPTLARPATGSTPDPPTRIVGSGLLTAPRRWRPPGMSSATGPPTTGRGWSRGGACPSGSRALVGRELCPLGSSELSRSLSEGARMDDDIAQPPTAGGPAPTMRAGGPGAVIPAGDMRSLRVFRSTAKAAGGILDLVMPLRVGGGGPSRVLRPSDDRPELVLPGPAPPRRPQVPALRPAGPWRATTRATPGHHAGDGAGLRRPDPKGAARRPLPSARLVPGREYRLRNRGGLERRGEQVGLLVILDSIWPTSTRSR